MQLRPKIKHFLSCINFEQKNKWYFMKKSCAVSSMVLLEQFSVKVLHTITNEGIKLEQNQSISKKYWYSRNISLSRYEFPELKKKQRNFLVRMKGLFIDISTFHHFTNILNVFVILILCEMTLIWETNIRFGWKRVLLEIKNHFHLIVVCIGGMH